MWERGLDWDNELPEDLLNLWQQYCTELSNIRKINIPRCYHAVLTDQNAPVEKEVYVFSDASESAYCAAAYLKVILENGECTVTSKTRVAPLKKVMLPDLNCSVLAPYRN